MCYLIFYTPLMLCTIYHAVTALLALAKVWHDLKPDQGFQKILLSGQVLSETQTILQHLIKGHAKKSSLLTNQSCVFPFQKTKPVRRKMIIIADYLSSERKRNVKTQNLWSHMTEAETLKLSIIPLLLTNQLTEQ